MLKGYMKKAFYQFIFLMFIFSGYIDSSEKSSPQFPKIRRCNSMPIPIPSSNVTYDSTRTISPIELQKIMNAYRQIHQKINGEINPLQVDTKKALDREYQISPFFFMDDDPSLLDNNN